MMSTILNMDLLLDKVLLGIAICITGVHRLSLGQVRNWPFEVLSTTEDIPDPVDRINSQITPNNEYSTSLSQ